jgi:hypothetical protein
MIDICESIFGDTVGSQLGYEFIFAFQKAAVFAAQQHVRAGDEGIAGLPKPVLGPGFVAVHGAADFVDRELSDHHADKFEVGINGRCDEHRGVEVRGNVILVVRHADEALLVLSQHLSKEPADVRVGVGAVDQRGAKIRFLEDTVDHCAGVGVDQHQIIELQLLGDLAEPGMIGEVGERVGI